MYNKRTENYITMAIQVKKQQLARKLIMVLALVWGSMLSQAQVEVGVKLGGSNYLGDSSPMLPVLTETKLSGGAFLNVHINPKFAIKAQLSQYNLSGNDANLPIPSTSVRGISFNTSLLDAGLALQYYPHGFQRCEKRWTPYLSAGLSFIKYKTISSNYSSATDNAMSGAVDESSFSIPMGVGVKKVLYKGLTLGAEVQAAKTFTDQLDFPSYLGNGVYKDWYMFAGLSLSYVFGKCDSDRRISHSQSMPCPVIKNVVGF